jgi:hypothetical protein
MIRRFLSLFRPQPVVVRGWRTCDAKRKNIVTPAHFGSRSAFIAFCLRMAEAVRDGHRTRAWYRERLKQVKRTYEHERYFCRPNEEPIG